MDIILPLVAEREPTVLRKPGQRPLHYPPVPPQLFRTFHALSGYASVDATFLERLRTLLIVVGFVGVQLRGTLPYCWSRYEKARLGPRNRGRGRLCGKRHNHGVRQRNGPPGQPLFGINTNNGGRIVIFAGGLPLMCNIEVIGAIGVSGGIVDQDQEVTQTGVAAFE